MSVSNPIQEAPAKPRDGLLLPSLDGANPLRFLAALGALQTLTSTNRENAIAMSWSTTRSGFRPLIHGIDGTIMSISGQIAYHLKCPFQTRPEAEENRHSAQRQFDEAKKKLKDAEGDLKQSGLKGKEREAAEAREIEPLREELAELRTAWLTTLAKCVPSRELSLGKHLNATDDELREASLQALSEAGVGHREIVDFFASFGSDACNVKERKQMQATPFCFITGSGHQDFLDTVRQLTSKVNATRLEQALCEESAASDEKLSMRWDPLEDRRYAYMWSDPTASNNVAKTNWALNLLAYRGLLLTQSVPTAKGLRTTGWPSGRQSHWTWPIWRGTASTAVVRSLLAHSMLAADHFDNKELAGLGIRALYRSNRIRVGKYVNFTPAQRIA